MIMTNQINWGDTEALAQVAGVKPASVRHSYCTRGHYLGLKPVKLPNRLLRWNLTEARRVLGLEVVEG